MTDQEKRGIGKTTARILRAIADAVESPGTWIQVRDHWERTVGAVEVKNIANRLGLRMDFAVKRKVLEIRSNPRRVGSIRKEIRSDNSGQDPV